jgi:hypothetical protein
MPGINHHSFFADYHLFQLLSHRGRPDLLKNLLNLMSKMQGKLKQKMRVNMEKHLGKMVKGLGKSLSLGMSVKIMRVMMARFLRVKLMIMLLRMGMGRLVMAS